MILTKVLWGVGIPLAIAVLCYKKRNKVRKGTIDSVYDVLFTGMQEYSNNITIMHQQMIL